MTGPEHYLAAERFAKRAAEHLTEDPADMRIAEIAMGIGQVHATLALAAATSPVSDATAWTKAVGYTPDDGPF